MQVKLRNKFYLKLFLSFWVFSFALLIIISFIAGQLSFKYWMSPREKIFINSYAVILINSLNEVKDKKHYLCHINQKLQNTFFLIDNKKELIYCKKPNINIKKMAHDTPDHAFIYDKYLVSDKIKSGNITYRLLSIKAKPLYVVFIQKYVAYRLMFAIIFSAILCYFISKYLTKPLKIVVDKMALFSEGNLSVRVGELLKNRQDEFTEIASEFDTMADSIQNLIQSKQQMLYNISHELRSPLARQRMSLDILKITPSDEHELLVDDIKKENELINALISEILMLAKLSTKTFTYQPIQTDVNAIIEKSINNINYEYQISTIKFKKLYEITSECDPKLISILIENLLKNAIKYSGINKDIHISATKNENTITISVSDEGPGVSKADLPYIFEPFKQSGHKNKIKANDNGYGLGLAIAKEIVKLHSGTIAAANNIPSGLIVTVHFKESYAT